MGAPAEQDAGPEATVLVVDDETNIVELLSAQPEVSGLRGTYGLQRFSRAGSAREARSDARNLDVMMPGMDGFGVLRRLRADGIDAPALFLTARAFRPPIL